MFSFGSFVHFELDLIESYFDNIRRIVKPGGNIVIHYSDKNKVLARRNPDFSDNTPDIMNKIVTNRDYRILEEDTTSLWHSSILRCTI